MRLLPPTIQRRSGRTRAAGLVEVAVSFAAVGMLSLISLKANLNNLSAQNWEIKQSMTDAYLSREQAYASRAPYDQLVGEYFGEFPRINAYEEHEVVIGKMPGGKPVTATLYRTRERIYQTRHLIEMWRLHSVLIYEAGGREYYKSRTTIRYR